DATALQIFTGQPQRWADPGLAEEDVRAFRAALEESEIQVTVSHDSYLINLASEKEELLEKSERAFRSELDRCVRLGLDYLVTHPGNATGGDREEALERNAGALARAIADHPGPTTVLVETTAGTGTALGWRFEELARLIGSVPEPERGRLGVCLDTCHAYAAGYDLREDYEGVIREFDRTIGLERLRLFHVNDSRHPLGSRKDRHADVGEGELGDPAFAALMSDRDLDRVPRVIETPKGDDARARDRANLGRLRALRDA
ncbi:MAG: deoxyribonuclease IV, partial [Gemmatimonadota bacterium]